MYRAIGVVVHAHGTQGVVYALAHRVHVESEVERAERHVFLHTGREELLVGVLEDEADGAAQRAQPGTAVVERLPGVADRAGLLAQEAVGVLKERRLAGAVGADQRVAAALGDRQRAAVEADVAVRVAEGDVLEREQR